MLGKRIEDALSTKMPQKSIGEGITLYHLERYGFESVRCWAERRYGHLQQGAVCFTLRLVLDDLELKEQETRFFMFERVRGHMPMGTAYRIIGT